MEEDGDWGEGRERENKERGRYLVQAILELCEAVCHFGSGCR